MTAPCCMRMQSPRRLVVPAISRPYSSRVMRSVIFTNLLHGVDVPVNGVVKAILINHVDGVLSGVVLAVGLDLDLGPAGATQGDDVCGHEGSFPKNTMSRTIRVTRGIAAHSAGLIRPP